jgi:SRSO17 transposase
MKPRDLKRLDRELTAYVDSLIEGMGRPERRQAMADYVMGLLLDGDRKSIEPMAGRLVDDVDEIQAMRQRLQQCVTVSPWSDAEVWRRLAVKTDADLRARAWVADDTGFRRKPLGGSAAPVFGRWVARTTASRGQPALAGSCRQLVHGMQLYLPESWTSDRDRCRAVGVPDDVLFQKKWEISSRESTQRWREGLRRRVVSPMPVRET